MINYFLSDQEMDVSDLTSPFGMAKYLYEKTRDKIFYNCGYRYSYNFYFWNEEAKLWTWKDQNFIDTYLNTLIDDLKSEISANGENASSEEESLFLL